MTTTAHLDALAAAARAHEAARGAAHEAKTARDALIRQALTAGCTYAQVGQVTGLGRAMLDRIRYSRVSGGA